MMPNKIIMIDDDQDTLTLYSISVKMEKLSDNFVTFTRPSEAKQHLEDCATGEQTPPAYIIADLNMPEIHGFDFVKEFEDEFMGKMPDCKIIITTSSIREQDKVEALAFQSVKEFIPKPISKAKLLELFNS